MRHRRYTNIDPCNLQKHLRDQLRHSIFLLADDETDNGGKVVACRHNATLVSPIIILSLPVFYTKYWTSKLTVAMGAWRFQQVWIALAAEVTNLHTVGPGVICRSLPGFEVDGISAAARVTKQIPTACPGAWERFLEKENLQKFHFTPLWSASHCRLRILPQAVKKSRT